MSRSSVPMKRRHGVAAVEMAVLLVPLLTLFLCAVELGRLVQVSQLVTNAAREGARMAAQGVNVQVLGNFVYVYTDSSSTIVSGTNPVYVKEIVNDYLITANITNVTGVTIEFKFLQADGVTDDTTRTDPWQGKKGDMFRLKVTVPYNNFRWTNMWMPANDSTSGKLFFWDIQSMSEQVKWGMMADDPFTVNTAIPNWGGTIPSGSKQWFGNGGNGL